MPSDSPALALALLANSNKTLASSRTADESAVSSNQSILGKPVLVPGASFLAPNDTGSATFLPQIFTRELIAALPVELVKEAAHALHDLVGKHCQLFVAYLAPYSEEQTVISPTKSEAIAYINGLLAYAGGSGSTRFNAPQFHISETGKGPRITLLDSCLIPGSFHDGPPEDPKDQAMVDTEYIVHLLQLCNKQTTYALCTSATAHAAFERLLIKANFNSMAATACALKAPNDYDHFNRLSASAKLIFEKAQGSGLILSHFHHADQLNYEKKAEFGEGFFSALISLYLQISHAHRASRNDLSKDMDNQLTTWINDLVKKADSLQKVAYPGRKNKAKLPKVGKRKRRDDQTDEEGEDDEQEKKKRMHRGAF